MTCAGISSLIITGLKRFQGQEFLVGDQIQNCGKGGINLDLQRGIDWIADPLPRRRELRQRPAVEVLLPLRPGTRRPAHRPAVLRRATTGIARGPRSWSTTRTSSQGFWQAASPSSSNPIVATSFALLFLAKGRAPVLINKLRHGPGDDWNNDPDDVRNLVGAGLARLEDTC